MCSSEILLYKYKLEKKRFGKYGSPIFALERRLFQTCPTCSVNKISDGIFLSFNIDHATCGLQWSFASSYKFSEHFIPWFGNEFVSGFKPEMIICCPKFYVTHFSQRTSDCSKRRSNPRWIEQQQPLFSAVIAEHFPCTYLLRSYKITCSQLGYYFCECIRRRNQILVWSS